MRVKSCLVLLSLALMLMIPQLVIAANPVHNFDCKNCHLSGLTINELGGANVCITCHGANPATVNMNLRPPATSDAGFVTGDASDQYGNNPVPVDETSHNWAATSTNPAAGSAEPIRALYPGFFSRYGTTVGKTACSRCHDPHGDFDTNKKLLPLTADNATPMTPNDMCLACHKTFGDSVQASHGLLSHPMVTDYAIFQGGDATNYKVVTEDSSTAPDAYANGVQLVNGDISCLSCHNLHFTDSDSSTVDGPLANPTNGDGLMLRGDGTQFVNDAAKATTFCTTCHNLDPAASMHGSASVDMGCMGCHGGHNYNNNNPSYFMLTDNYTELPTEFGGLANREDLWGGTQLGVVDGFCETCHGDIGDPPFNAVRGHNQGEDCSVCHLSHAEGAFSKPIGCDGCHGSPPRVNAPGNSVAAGYDANGYAWAPSGSVEPGQYDYTTSGHLKDESTTPHASHAGTPSRYSFSCDTCHNTHINNFATTHNRDNTSFRDVLESGGGNVFNTKSVAPGAADPLYNDGTASCDNVYCHSNGGVNDGLGARSFTFTQPGWAATKDTIVGQAGECASCHGNDSTSMTGSSNSAAHQAHLGQGYNCNICHVDTASSGTALQPGAINAKHMNQLVDVVFDEASVLKAGGSNVAHGSTPWEGPGNVTCSAVYCHSTGQDAVPADRVYKSITWTSAATLDCTSCHDITAGTDQTAAHTAHVSGSTSNVGRDLDCAVCHDDTMNAGNNTAIAAVAFHVNGQVDVAMPASIDPAQDCSTSLCHSDGNIDSVTDHVATANPKNNTPPWTLADTTPGTFNACDKCHGDDATNKAYPAYADGGVAGNDANSHNAHVGSSTIECDQCHSDTSTAGTSLDGDDPTQHVDQTIDVVFRQGGTFNAGDTCSATYCHGTGPSPAWGDTSSLLCDTCHNASAALADSHPAHYESATVAVGSDFTAANNSSTTEYIFNCGNCHSSGISHAGGEVSANQAAEVILDGTGAYVADSATSAGTDRGFSYTAGSCGTNDCHNDGTAAKGAPNTVAPQWTVALAADCTGCHNNNAAAVGNEMASVSHAAHMNDGSIMADKSCESCHTVTVDNTDRAIADKSQHANQVRNVDIDANWDSNATPGDNWDGVDCTNVYCHSDAQGAYQAVTWGATISDCVSCHDTTGATTTLSGAHKAHTFGVTTTVGKDLDCGECHADTVTVGDNSAITGAAAHVDKTKTIKVAIDNSTCNNIQCHSDGNVGNLQYNNPAWGSTLDCFNCHGNGTDQSYPSYADGGSTTVNANSHNAHVGSSTIKCEECHNNTSTAGISLDGATPSVHVDQNIDMAFKQGGTFDAGETCSATYCHGSGASPAWGNTTPLLCNTCHNASVALADSHPAHYQSATVAVGSDFTAANNSSTTEYIFNCGNCHSSGISHAGGAVSGVQAAEVILAGSGTYAANSTAAAASPDRGFAFTDGSCGTNDCHNDGTATKGAPNTVAPQWTGSLAADCTGCHNNNAAAASAMASVSHGAHMNDGSIMADKSCESCHTVTVDNTDRAIADKSQHANQVRNVDIDANWDSNATPGDNWDGVDCTNVYCHSDAQGAYQAVTWGATISDCVSCHDTTGATTTLSGAHKAHTFGVTTTVGKDLDCGECHADTVTVGDNSAITGAVAHVDKTKTIKVAIDNSTCNNIQCHSDGNVGNLQYNNPAWGSALDCFNCHGNGTDQSYPSYADGGSTTVNANSHNAHVGSSTIKCEECHNNTSTAGISLDGATPSVHVDQNIDMAFKQGGTFDAGETCSATYCHGTGPSPAWGDTSPLVCNTCHNASVALADSHPAHYESATVAVGSDFTAANNSSTTEYIFNCGNCHSTGISHAGGAVSADQAAEVFFSSGGTHTPGTTVAADRGFNYTDGTCASTYCHSDGNGGVGKEIPQWTATLSSACGACHNADWRLADPVADRLDTGNHQYHIRDDRSNVNCTQCHTDTTADGVSIADKSKHVNATKDVAWGSLTSDGTAYVDASTTCSNLYCHSDGQKSSQPYTVPLIPVQWDTVASLSCNGCHDNANATTTLSSAHISHTFNATTTLGRELDCGECHADTVTVGSNTNITGYPNHVDGIKTIKVAIDNSTCNNINCHSDGNAGNLQYNNPAWGSSLDCFNCHGNGTDQSYPSYADGGSTTVNANSHNAHVGSSTIKCEECHSNTSIAGTSLDGATPSVHVDQNIDMAFKQGGTFNGDETCSTTYCHGTGPSPAWGNTSPLVCNTCHNASNALADSHPAHYESATVAVGSDFTAANNSSTTEYIFNCGNCHSTGISHAGGAVSGVQAAEVILAGSGTYAANATAAAASPDRGFAFTDGSCGTNDCHNDGTAAKGAPNTVAPQWTSTLAATCTGCHNNNVASGSAMATVAHPTHLTTVYGSSKTCNTCHNATVDGTDRAISDKSVHVNGALNVAIIGSLDGGNNAYAGSCNAVYCHSTGQSTSNGSLATPTYATATWATPASGACGTCHKVTEATGLTSGSHGEHLGTTGVNGCADCHTGALNDASAYNSANHVNTLIDVANTYTLGGAPGNGYGTCSTASCHDDGTGVLAVTPQWGTAGGCASCHASDMTSGSHNDHLLSSINQAAISCGNCHDSAVKDTTAPALHLNALVDVYNSAVGDFGGDYTTGKAKGSAYGSCATTYCHGDTLAYSAGDGIDTSPLWGSTQGTNPNNCDACHGFPPNGGGSHPTNNDCNACHFHVNAVNTGFDDVTLHIDRIIQIDGGDACLDCHDSVVGYKSPDSGDHLVHTVADTLLTGKGLLAGDYGSGAWWYDVSYDAAGRPLMGCGQCHPDTVSTHLNSIVDTDLDPAGETITAPNAKLGSLAGAAYSGGTCSSVYCHSNGDGTFADSPSWDTVGGNAGVDCASCHGNSPTTAAHGVHEVGIHYAELYDPATPGLLTATGNVGSGAGHGDTDVSTTINCFTCHNGTVTDSANAGNATCSACHSDANNILVGDELARIQVSSTVHLNGAKDVTFADLSTYKTKAQLRDNLSDADDGTSILSNIWNRITGYKGATDYDQPQAAFATPVYASGTATCSTVACHNNNDATWAAPANDCMSCHTSLPK